MEDRSIYKIEWLKRHQLIEGRSSYWMRSNDWRDIKWLKIDRVIEEKRHQVIEHRTSYWEMEWSKRHQVIEDRLSYWRELPHVWGCHASSLPRESAVSGSAVSRTATRSGLGASWVVVVAAASLPSRSPPSLNRLLWSATKASNSFISLSPCPNCSKKDSLMIRAPVGCKHVTWYPGSVVSELVLMFSSLSSGPKSGNVGMIVLLLRHLS